MFRTAIAVTLGLLMMFCLSSLTLMADGGFVAGDEMQRLSWDEMERIAGSQTTTYGLCKVTCAPPVVVCGSCPDSANVGDTCGLRTVNYYPEGECASGGDGELCRTSISRSACVHCSDIYACHCVGQMGYPTTTCEGDGGLPDTANFQSVTVSDDCTVDEIEPFYCQN